MRAFFENVDLRAASGISDVSRRMFDLRERRKRLLADTGCSDSDEVLAAVREGRLPEHPGYDAWLAVCLLGDREHALYATLQWRCLIANGGKRLPPPRSGLAALAYTIRPALPSLFTGGMRLHPDGISFSGESGIQVMVRVLTPQAWSFEWHWAGEPWRLDTAPVAHPGVDSVAHVHRPDGAVVASPITLPLMGETPAVVLAFLEALAHSPTLGLD